MKGGPPDRWYRFGAIRGAWIEALRGLSSARAAARIWSGDPTLWKSDPEHRKIIENALGWLTVPEAMRPKIPEIEAWCRDELSAGTRDAVLCGMGGSSLAPEVFARTFQQPDRPRLQVLDSTSPEQVRDARSRIEPGKTVFFVSSKSGSTLETLSHFRYFHHETAEALGSEEKASKRFVAITDPGSPLDKLASERGFSRIFRNFPDIGGRYSALSFFGLVPASLCGADVSRLLGRAAEAAEACRAPDGSPGLELGAALGAAALHGRDKLTIFCTPGIAPFGTWLEQLVAESTGKEGRGIVPVEGEAPGWPEDYREDRIFVYERLRGDSDGSSEERLGRLAEEGHPVAAFSLRDRYDLGARMFAWEFAVAVAGSILRIDAFDQPNVQESKDNTNAVLREFERNGRLPESPDGGSVSGPEFAAALRGLFSSIRAGRDYLSLQLYAERDEESERLAAGLRKRLRDAIRCATTVGFGPRFLHSTGQLHKGGPDEGVFLQFVAPGGPDVAIPGAPYGFAAFLRAQAIGDAQALTSRKRRFLTCRFGGASLEGLRELVRAADAAREEYEERR